MWKNGLKLKIHKKFDQRIRKKTYVNFFKKQREVTRINNEENARERVWFRRLKQGNLFT